MKNKNKNPGVKKIQVKCSHCLTLQNYDFRGGKRKRKKCSHCGKSFTYKTDLSLTMSETKKLYSKSKTNNRQKAILEFLENSRSSQAQITIQKYLEDSGFDTSYYKCYRDLQSLTKKKLISKHRKSCIFYSLVSERPNPIYDLSKIPFPQRISAHNLQFKVKINKFPVDWVNLRDHFKLWDMKSWDGDGRIIENDAWNFGIKITPSNAIFYFAETYRYITDDCDKAIDYVINTFQTGPWEILNSLGFDLSKNFKFYRKPEWAFPDIPLDESDNFTISSKNGEVILSKDNSPKIIGEYETDDRGMAQSIIDVVKNQKRLLIDSKNTTKAITAIVTSVANNLQLYQNLQKQFMGRAAIVDVSIKTHTDQIEILQKQIIDVSANVSTLTNNLIEINSNLGNLTTKIAEGGII